MPADAPTILATSAGLRRGRRTTLALGPIIEFAIELSGVSGRPPRLCFVGTAQGDQRFRAALFAEACAAAGVTSAVLNLFSMPNVDDVAAHVLAQDVIWVDGGSVANLLALWRLHGLDEVFATAWSAGVVLAGVSAGSICWHAGGTTDSFGPELRVIDALGFVPFSNRVHYDTEPARRPTFERLIATGALPPGYAAEDGVGLYYRGTSFVEAVTEQRNKAAYYVERVGEAAVEERIEPRELPGAE